VGFAAFYQDGGFFMHVITLLGAVTAGALVRGVVERRIAKARGVEIVASSGTVLRLSLIVVLVGVLATIDATVQACHALQTISIEQWPRAIVRCGELVGIPLAWSMIVASTLLFADAVIGRRR
jgi:hypothetical protein